MNARLDVLGQLHVLHKLGDRTEMEVGSAVGCVEFPYWLLHVDKDLYRA